MASFLFLGMTVGVLQSTFRLILFYAMAELMRPMKVEGSVLYCCNVQPWS